MSPILSSQSMVLATAMAVSGTVILLAFRLQKSSSSSPPSCIIPSDDGNKNDKRKKKKKKNKRVHFAEDVLDPIGNSEEYRKAHSGHKFHPDSTKRSNASFKLMNKGGKVREMPANRVALYNGILRDRIGCSSFHTDLYC